MNHSIPRTAPRYRRLSALLPAALLAVSCTLNSPLAAQYRYGPSRAAEPVSRTSTTVEVRLTEWAVELSPASVPWGEVVFHIVNAGGIPHAFEVEGHGIEKEIPLLKPGAEGTLKLQLKPARYEAYCPVGEDSHKKLGMESHFEVTAAASHEMQAPAEKSSMGHASEALVIKGGGPVIQILPGPFPFADSAAAVIADRPEDQKADLTHKASEGPYSNNVKQVSGDFTLSAWDRGPTRDSVSGVASFRTDDGARWKVVMDRVQTKDIPFNPRFGGVIMGLYYHGASGVHTPLVPTIQSKVALWAYAHVYRNDQLVTDTAMVHVMLLSRTRRPGTYALACWDCSKNPVEELQLQITTPPGTPKLEAPGEFLFLNWEKSTARALN
ncbi:MAG: hypothetical protein ABJD11_05120 [Gemmatimonadota bacterium]